MMRRFVAIAVLLGTLVASPVSRGVAGDDAPVAPVLRLEVDRASVPVGEALTLRVTVLVPTWFPRPPVYPDFELANAITRLPPDSSYATSERIAGETWSGIVRQYRIYPLAAGAYRIDDASMRVAWADPGSAAIVRDVPLPAVAFRAFVPPGAEDLDPYLAGSSLELTLGVEGDGADLEAGDAVVLTYSATVAGLPSMFLPPLAPEPVAPAGGGVSVYADAPRFGDGDGVGRRSERLTLLFDAGGTYTMPAVALDYWDRDEGAIRTARVEGLTFTVAGSPAEAGDGSSLTGGRTPWLVAAALLLLLAMASRPAVLRRLREARRAWRASEACAWRALRRALKAQPEPVCYRALQAWLDRLAPGMGPRRFARAYGDSALLEEVEALSARCFADRAGPLDRHRLAAGLRAARRRCLDARPRHDALALRPLNP